MFCEASIFNFQNKLLSYFNETGIDLLQQVFERFTQNQLSKFEVKTTIQRGDSFLVGSNIVDYSRLHLLIEMILRVSKILDNSDKKKLAQFLTPYTTNTASSYTYHVKKEDLPKELIQIAQLYAKLYLIMGEKYLENPQYQNFVRVMKDHFEISDPKKKRKIRVKEPGELHSGILMSPDDAQATFRFKGKTKCKGYSTHVSETINEDNKVNLITDIVVVSSNIDDSKILEQQLPKMLESTSDIEEYHVDGNYGSYEVDKICKKENIKMYHKNIRGRKSYGGFKIKEDERTKQVSVSCEGGQTIEAHYYNEREGKMKAEFDYKKCSECPLNDKCSAKIQGGKRKPKRRVYLFGENNYWPINAFPI